MRIFVKTDATGEPTGLTYMLPDTANPISDLPQENDGSQWVEYQPIPAAPANTTP